jgi:shikimate dehydrogenase
MPFEIKPENLKNSVDSIKVLGIAGVNITIPHKESVMQYLDRIDPLAKKIGSVNTIVNNNGVLTGYNTDGKGFLKDLSLNGINPKGKTVLLIGAGGAGRALAGVLSLAGAKKIFITDQDQNRAKKLSASINKAEFEPFKTCHKRIQEADILINATPIGMHKGDPSIIKMEHLNKNIFIYDVIYNRKTLLLEYAKKVKARHSGGLGMLLYQGAFAFELWTNKKAPVTIMKKELLKNIAQM